VRYLPKLTQRNPPNVAPSLPNTCCNFTDVGLDLQSSPAASNVGAGQQYMQDDMFGTFDECGITEGGLGHANP
jgi:hypothetical protein